jgi:hypothetical protein
MLAVRAGLGVARRREKIDGPMARAENRAMTPPGRIEPVTRPIAIQASMADAEHGRLVNEMVLRFARSFLGDVEVHETLSDRNSDDAPQLQSKPCTFGSTLSEVIGNAAPDGLRLSRMGHPGPPIIVPAEKAEAFVRALLWPAALELARLEFDGPEEELTTREELGAIYGELEAAGDPLAAAYQIAPDDSGPEEVDQARNGIFARPLFDDLAATHGFAETDDDARLEAQLQVRRTANALIAQFNECEVDTKPWRKKLEKLTSLVDELIAEGFKAQGNRVPELTLAIFEAVQRTLGDVGVTTIAVYCEYSGKRVERVQRALRRARRAKAGTTAHA